MIPVLFAIIAGVGAWTAWRRNPLYSTRSALRSAVFVLLAIAAVIGVIVGVVNLTINRSPAVAGIAIGTVVLLGTLSLIFIIQSVTTPKEAKLATGLPPSAKVVSLHRQKVYKWAKLSAMVLAIVGILGIAIPGDGKIIVLVPGGMALFVALITLPTAYFKARGLDRGLTAVLCNPWVHWQYTPEQWKQWADTQGERTKANLPQITRQRRMLTQVLMATVIAVIVLGVLIFYPGSSLLLRILSALSLGGGTYAFCVWKTRYDQSAPERVRSNLLKATPEAYVGRDGLFCDGAFTTWLSMSIYVTSAAIDVRPPRSLVFRFMKYVGTNPYGVNASSGSIPVERKVLIPPGADSDIARLQQELTARCPKARIGLS
jgi:hypothetical protein